jgi:hypothetical protein
VLWKCSVFKGCEFPRVLYIGREVALMMAYEIISIFIGILALLMSSGSLIVALLAFLDRDKDHKRKK